MGWVCDWGHPDRGHQMRAFTESEWIGAGSECAVFHDTDNPGWVVKCYPTSDRAENARHWQSVFAEAGLAPAVSDADPEECEYYDEDLDEDLQAIKSHSDGWCYRSREVMLIFYEAPEPGYMATVRRDVEVLRQRITDAGLVLWDLGLKNVGYLDNTLVAIDFGGLSKPGGSCGNLVGRCLSNLA